MAERRSYGARFASHRMAANYRFRPDYSSEVYYVLAGLLRSQPRSLLDAGCGSGKIVRGLVDQIDRADAVDPSEEMLRLARSLRAGGDPKIRWVSARIEDAELSPPYGLIVAAASIHWMELDRVLPRFKESLAPGAFLAVLDGDSPIDPPWGRGGDALHAGFPGEHRRGAAKMVGQCKSAAAATDTRPPSF